MFAMLAGSPAADQSADSRTLGLFDDIVRLQEGDWRDLRAGRTVARTLPVGYGEHLAIVMAGRTTVTSERFLAGVRNSAQLWRGSRVPRSGTIGNPAAPGDVSTMVLSVEDLRAVRTCRPGDCDVKLAASEMTRLKRALQTKDQPWEDAVQQEFRAIVLDRVEAYRRNGVEALPPPHDHQQPVDLKAVFSRLLAATPALPRHAPSIAEYLNRYPRLPLPEGADEVTYWLETGETPKPTVQALHAVLQRRPEGEQVEALVVTRQIFATHYVSGSLSVSALIRDPQDPSRRYLVYVNRSAADGLVGFLSGIRRFVIERRVRSAARGAFEHLRDALERPST
jgi:hypothetical protein